MTALTALQQRLRSPLVAVQLCHMLISGEVLVDLGRGRWAPADRPTMWISTKSVNVMGGLVQLFEVVVDITEHGSRPVRRWARAVRIAHPVPEHLHAAALCWQRLRAGEVES